MTVNLDLHMPLDFGSATASNSIQLKLELPDNQTVVRSLREIPNADEEEFRAREQHVSFDGLARIRVNISNRLNGHGFFANVPLQFQIGIGQPIPARVGLPPITPLLQGRILLDFDQLRPRLFPDFNRLLRRCWLTSNLDEIKQLRFEPSGFYIAGEMPSGLLPGNQRTWVLRVPQPKLGEPNSQTIPLPERTPNNSVWELTSEEFEFQNNTVNATDFIRAINATFRDFESDNRKLLDSVTDQPQTTAAVRFNRVNNRLIQWHASAAETRLVVGGLQAGESLFEPNFLIGEIHAPDGRSWHHHHTSYLDAQDLAGALSPTTDQLVSLSLSKPDGPPLADDVELEFPEVKMSGLNVPTVTTEASGDLQVLDPNSNEVRQRETVERAWICLEQGWLGLDADLPELKLKDNAVTSGRMGVLAIDALMKMLRPEIDGQGFSLRLLPQANNHAAIKLVGEHRSIMTLEVNRPMSVLTTPPMWYEDLPQLRESPDQPGAPQTTRTAGWVPSLAMRLEKSGAEPVSTPNGMVQPTTDDRDSLRGQVNESEQTIREILRQADWITETAVDLEESSSGFPEGFTPQIFQARIQWNDGFGISIPVDRSRVVFWNRPTAVPVLRTFPQNTSQVPTAMLEDQRGMIPYELRNQSVSLIIEIPQQQLPRLRLTEFEFAVSQSPEWRPMLGPEVLLMLPTLPGAEAKVDGDDVHWELRHSVPVLDESYRETKESDEALTSQVIDDSIDITRVEQATAFEIAVGETETANWLNLSTVSENLVDILAFSPRGTQPELKIELANNETITFSRTKNVAGLTQGVSVTSTDRGSRLPDYSVEFGDENSEWEIRRNGQPLVHSSSPQHGITTLDGRGTVRGESIGIKTSFRPQGELNDQIKRTASYHGTDLALEVIGLEEKSFDACHDPLAQYWTFHDGKGDWAQFMGFGLFPMQQSFDSDAAATVTCQLLPLAQLATVVSPGSYSTQTKLARSSSAVVDANFALTDGFPGTLQLTDVTGKFQWRFESLPPPVTGVDRSVSVQGISASVTDVQSDHAIVDIHELVLRTPLGTVRLAQNGLQGKLQSGLLSIAPTKFELKSAGDQIGATIELAAITIDSNVATQAIVSQYFFTWTQDDSENASWTLVRKHGDTPWTFSLLLSGKNESFQYVLSESKVAQRTFVFGAEAKQVQKNTGSFDVIRSDGILGVEFSTSTHLRFLVGELMFGLKSRSGGPDTLAARMRLSNQSIDDELEVTGVFRVENSIEFRSDDGPVSHSIQFFLDRAKLPIVPLLMGVAAGPPRETAVIAEHTLTFPDGRTFRWQSPQWLRFRSFKNFRETYFSTPSDSTLPPETLVLDSGTVTWLQQPEREQVKTPRALPDIYNPEYEIAIAIRPIESTRVDKQGFFLRMPFASIAASEKLHVIDLKLTEGGLVTDSRGAQREGFRLPFRRPESELQFFQRNGAADILDAGRLAAGLSPLQGDHALPAYNNDSGKPTDYPAELSDLAPVAQIASTGEPIGLLATTVIRRHPAETGVSTDPLSWWKSNGQVLFGATLLDLGYQASVLDANDLGKTSNVQLLAVQPSGIVPVVDQRLDEITDERILAWARKILDQKSQRLHTVVLRNYSDFIVIPATFQQLRDEVPEVFAFADQSTSIDVDPRLFIPGHISIDHEKVGDRGKLACLSPEPNVSLYPYEAHVTQTELSAPERPVVAATHFRIATIHDGAAARMMCPALASSMDATHALTWSQYDEVAFAANNETYPEINALALANLPFPTFDLRENTSTLLPPLMHCVSWAARPGEISSTTWTSESFEITSDSMVARRSKPSVVSLRRPRALSGIFESVRLLNPDGGPLENTGGYVLQRRFVYSEFDLEQTLGRTTKPETDKINGVLVTDETFSASHEEIDDAKPEPALVYDLGSEPRFKLSLQLFAGSDYDPNSTPGATAPIETQSFLVLAIDDKDLPASYANGAVPDLPSGMVSLLVDGSNPASIPKPVQNGGTPQQPWKKLAGSDSVYHLTLDHVATALADLLGSLQPVPSFKILIARYQLNPDDDIYHLRTATEMALSIQVLDKAAAITAPKTSVTLLRKTSSSDAYVIGHGRLSPGDFSLPSAQFGKEGNPRDGSNQTFIKWLRYSRIRSLDRSRLGDDVNIPDRDYDVVVYGPGGELIPTRR